jgi:hypothetical protein
VRAGVVEGKVFAVDIGDDHFFAIERNQLHVSRCHVRGFCNSLEFGHGYRLLCEDARRLRPLRTLVEPRLVAQQFRWRGVFRIEFHTQRAQGPDDPVEHVRAVDGQAKMGVIVLSNAKNQC